ncbi:MAG: hypothetical protein ABW073_01025 [Acidimicrobiia bacterium]
MLSRDADVEMPDVVLFGVELVAWPDDPRLTALRAAGVPCLVLVAPDDRAPVLDGDLEDWVRVPVDDRELEVRCRRLARLAAEAGVG